MPENEEVISKQTDESMLKGYRNYPERSPNGQSWNNLSNKIKYCSGPLPKIMKALSGSFGHFKIRLFFVCFVLFFDLFVRVPYIFWM